MSPWIRLDDDYINHPKFVALSHIAFRLWHEGMAYSRKLMTDGIITIGALKTFRYSSKSAVKELVTPLCPGASPLWEEHEGGFEIHDYLDWNPTKDVEVGRRESSRERLRKHREKRVSTQDRNALSAHSVRTEQEQGSSDLPVISRSSVDQIQKEPRAREYQASSIIGKNTHLSHAACDPTLSRCVPTQVQFKLMDLLAPKYDGDREAARAALQAWYPGVWASLPPGFVMGESFRFWQGRFDAFWASEDTSTKRASSLPQTDDLLAKVKDRLAKEAEQRGRMS